MTNVRELSSDSGSQREAEYPPLTSKKWMEWLLLHPRNHRWGDPDSLYEGGRPPLAYKAGRGVHFAPASTALRPDKVPYTPFTLIAFNFLGAAPMVILPPLLGHLLGPIHALGQKYSEV